MAILASEAHPIDVPGTASEYRTLSSEHAFTNAFEYEKRGEAGKAHWWLDCAVRREAAERVEADPNIF